MMGLIIAGMILGVGLGLIFGSFLGALIMRWPQGKSVMRGRSACDGCGRTLRAWELVPVISAALARGRCRGCGARIDRVHGLMELGCGIIGAAAMTGAMMAVGQQMTQMAAQEMAPGAGGFQDGAMIGLSGMRAMLPGLLPAHLLSDLPWAIMLMLAALPEALGWMILGWSLLTLAVLDARHYWLPDKITLPLLFLGLTIGPWVTGVDIRDALIGAAVGYGALVVVALGYKMLRGRDGLGLGDAKLLGALGAWLGWQVLPFILLLASVAGLLWVLARKMAGDDIGAMTRIAFGTFLCMAALPAHMMLHLLMMRG